MESRLEGLLKPVSAEAPCGADMSFSPEFDLIHEARREDDPTVDYGEWQATLKQADWSNVIASCSELLKMRSKDIRLAAWLTEGLVNTSGLSGLGEGLEVVAQLLDRFGGDVHPRAEEGDQEQRIGCMAWLIQRMAQLVRQIPLSQSKVGIFSLNHYDSARLLQAQLERSPESVSDIDSKATLEKFSSSVAKTDSALYEQWIGDLEKCRSALNHLVRASDILFGLDGPSFGPLAESLDAVQLRLDSICKERGIFAGTKTGGAESENIDHAVDSVFARQAGPIVNRAHALELLRQVATYFRNTEPHSPVAYLADKAAHWGSMPLHAWLRSVVKDAGTLSHIEELLGLEADKG